MKQAGSALIHGDALRIPLRDESVDAVISSPPYWALRSYRDGDEHYDGQIGSEPDWRDFLEALWAVTAECARVLKPTGSLFVNLGDKYAGSRMDGSTGHDTFPLGAIHRRPRQGALAETLATGGIPTKSLMGLPWRYAIGCMDRLGLTLRAELIWSKPNGLPESVTDRVRRSHEQWFHMTKQGRYYAAVDEIREAHLWGAGRLGTSSGTYSEGSGRNDAGTHGSGGFVTNNPLGKLPGSVWTIPSEPLRVPDHIGVDHFAAFPQEWCRRLILGWTPGGICTACGEGRVPVVSKEQVHIATRSAAAIERRIDVLPTQPGGEWTSRHDETTRTEATITGYRCACDVTLAPTRPAVILDPFVGTGTVPMVARALGRYGVGLDLSRDYLRLAHWRINDSRHAAKSTNRTNRERQGHLW